MMVSLQWSLANSRERMSRGMTVHAEYCRKKRNWDVNNKIMAQMSQPGHNNNNICCCQKLSTRVQQGVCGAVNYAARRRQH